jgi:hypothetical protein
LELDENLHREFTIFEAAPQETRGIPSKKPQAISYDKRKMLIVDISPAIFLLK